MTPRRSSRARTTQPSPALLQHTNSNSSGNSASRGERNTRSNHKLASPQRSSTQRSQSIDESDGKPDLPQTRQRNRARDDDNDDLSQPNEDEEVDEDENDEEEITRCLCGQQEYPGLPPSRRSATGRHPHQARGRDNGTIPKDEADPMSDDLGSMFIQCDLCKVWQHGGCVGIMDEAMSPDEYYCEECRKDLHKISTESNGTHSSQYLPVAPVFSSGPSSRESSRDNARRSRDSRSRADDNPKRRSTMNSRDAAYDEEELLRRAIEESKEESRMSNDETSSRRTKRSRSDEELNKQTVKRPRTSSPSPSALSKQSIPVSQPVSEEDETKSKVNGAIRPKRGVLARNQRDKETKEPEEQQEEEEEIEQPEPVTRRKSRSEKKRGDESDHEGEASPTKPPAPAPAPAPSEPDVSEPTPGTPVPVTEPAAPPPPPRQSTRKSGRPPARRGGRLGRNQYTRDRDINGDGTNSPNSPHGSHFRDNGRGSPSIGGPNGTQANGAESNKGGKSRHLNPHRTSMNEVKRRVAAILDFISRMQVEMAASGETVTPPDNNGNGNNGLSARASLVKGVQDQLGSMLTSANSEGASTASSTAASAADYDVTKEREKDFKELSSVEMMDVLTRHLLKWQQEYGKYGEK